MIHIAAVIFVLVTIILVIWIGEYLMVYPKSSIDYVAKFNLFSEPRNFDPNSNAWPDLAIAFNNLIDRPNDLEPFFNLWPEDMNEAELKIASDWINKNETAIKYLVRASGKQYAWHPYKSKTNHMIEVFLPHIKKYRNTGQLLTLKARFLASEQDFSGAFELLKDAYKYGAFFSGYKHPNEQFAGLDIRSIALRAAFEIIYYANPPEKTLADFQEVISQIYSQYPFYISFEYSQLTFFDEVRRNYDKNKGFWPMLQNIMAAYGIDPEGISMESTLTVAQECYAYAERMAPRTPYELHVMEVEQRLDRIKNKNRIVSIFSPPYLRNIGYAHRCSAGTQALIVVLALERYKIKNGDYPDSLSDLQRSGYIENIPTDPFSPNPFVYRKRQDDFVLYSLAGDMDDDYGEHDNDWADDGDGDYVFWPIQEN